MKAVKSRDRSRIKNTAPIRPFYFNLPSKSTCGSDSVRLYRYRLSGEYAQPFLMVSEKAASYADPYRGHFSEVAVDEGHAAHNA